jgi:hypothetical protein
MEKLMFLAACLVALASTPVIAQLGGPNVVIVQVYTTGLGSGHIAITQGEGRTEDVEFKVTNIKQHTAAEPYQRVFAQLVQERYSLKSTFFPKDGSTVTLVFEKKS